MLRDGKRTGTIMYYVSPPVTVLNVAFVVVMKRGGSFTTELCKEYVVEQTPIHDHVVMKFYPKVLKVGHMDDKLRYKAVQRAIDTMDCYMKPSTSYVGELIYKREGVFIDMKLSHLFQDGADNVIVGDLDEGHFTVPTFPSPSFKPSEGPTMNDAIWSVMVLIINTYIYPTNLYKESWIWSKREQLDLRDDAHDLIKESRKHTKDQDLLNVAYDIMDERLKSLNDVRATIMRSWPLDS
jgi:hypothetical protein